MKHWEGCYIAGKIYALSNMVNKDVLQQDC